MRTLVPIGLLVLVLALATAAVLWSGARAQAPLPAGRHAFSDGRVSLDLPAGGVDVTRDAYAPPGGSLRQRLFPPRPPDAVRVVHWEREGLLVSSTRATEEGLRALVEHADRTTGGPLLEVLEQRRLPGGAEALLVRLEPLPGRTRSEGPSAVLGLWVFDGATAHELRVLHPQGDAAGEARARAVLDSARLVGP